MEYKSSSILSMAFFLIYIFGCFVGLFLSAIKVPERQKIHGIVFKDNKHTLRYSLFSIHNYRVKDLNPLMLKFHLYLVENSKRYIRYVK